MAMRLLRLMAVPEELSGTGTTYRRHMGHLQALPLLSTLLTQLERHTRTVLKFLILYYHPCSRSQTCVGA